MELKTLMKTVRMTPEMVDFINSMPGDNFSESLCIIVEQRMRQEQHQERTVPDLPADGAPVDK